ncbi:shikimate dehydrogenase [Mesorhizobium sp. LHD-90]|uniref:shikimate dehydrogenase n=1 Tax=Mesorhizobium sp. LHD-90 TaxID=3071414 RepID=UPI0027DF120E|nr:shikimate dehydrogenase [Mesorhizobium sp. LHD-90]MDQ6435295.1 shikimate dehydrogenase [Mesorhizobium sp. LHD-90]
MADKLVDLFRRIAAGHRGTAVSGREHVVVGLVGRGIQSSRTPGMHEREAQRLGIGYSYRLLDFDGLALPDEAIGDVVAAAQATGFQGLNVTHPFKQAVMPALDGLSPEARAIGAVNTIVFADGRKQGHNTDAWGFAESFREAMAGAPLERVAMFGAGGAGAAVAYALMELGVRDLVVVDSDASRADDLAQRMTARFPRRVRTERDAAGAVAAVDGIVNATPVGMAKYPGTPFDTALLTPEKWVADIIYFPAETELLRAARAVGCRTLPGIGMAIGQAVRAFELFTGRKADRRAMADHFEAAA